MPASCSSARPPTPRRAPATGTSCPTLRHTCSAFWTCARTSSRSAGASSTRSPRPMSPPPSAPAGTSTPAPMCWAPPSRRTWPPTGKYHSETCPPTTFSNTTFCTSPAPPWRTVQRMQSPSCSTLPTTRSCAGSWTTAANSSWSMASTPAPPSRLFPMATCPCSTARSGHRAAAPRRR